MAGGITQRSSESHPRAEACDLTSLQSGSILGTNSGTTLQHLLIGDAVRAQRNSETLLTGAF
jgi:hypothetical protein